MVDATSITVSIGQLGGFLVGIFAVLTAIIGVLAYTAGRRKQTTEDGIKEGTSMTQMEILKGQVNGLEEDQEKLGDSIARHDITLGQITVQLEMILTGQKRLEDKIDILQAEERKKP